MMKKNIVVVMVMVVALLAASFPVAASSADDYKVIKNAVKSKKRAGGVSYFHVEVKDKNTKKSKVKIKVPAALIDLLAECTKDEIKIKGDCDIDFKKVLKILKSQGPMTLVEIDDDDVTVKIWFD